MRTNLQESADWFKLMNEICNIRRNILCKVPAHAAIRYEKKKIPWIQGCFHDKILAENYWRLSIIKNYTLIWRPK